MSADLTCAVCGTALQEPGRDCPVCKTDTTLGASDFPRLPGFQIVALLGRGGMGSVYLAEDSSLGRKVAVKVLAEKYHGDPEARDRFLREARALAGIDHPNVLRIHSLSDAQGIAFIVMEYVEGETLARRISRGPMPAAEALRVARQAAAGLAAAWEKGIVHRDVKPSNILLDTSGQVRVADFGLAKPVHIDGSFATSTGIVLGTPHYISPEQARGEAVDLRSDIYSLGVALYEMATGKRPFVGATPVEVLAHHLHSPMPALSSTTGLLTPVLERAIGRMTQKRAADRPGSHKELSDLLREDAPDRQGLGRRAVVALVLVLVAGIGLYIKASGTFGRGDAGAPETKSVVDPDATYNERSVDVPPKYLSGGASDPLYEYLPDAKGKEGCLGTVSVRVEFVVTASGDVTELQARTSKLAAGAMLGVSGRKYSPAIKAGLPVRVRLTRRYEASSPFISLPVLRSQVDSIQRGRMAPEFAVGCVSVLTNLLTAGASFSAEGLRALTALPRVYTVEDPDLDTIGWMLATSGHAAEAMEVFQTRLARLPETAAEYERIGDGFAEIGQQESALKAYRLSLALEPARDKVAKKLTAAQSTPAEGTFEGARVYAEAEVDLPPKLKSTGTSLSSGRPRLPPGENATVTLSWVVAPTGEPANVKLHLSGGPEADQFIVNAVQTWRYEPGMKAGAVVPVRIRRKYTFVGKSPATPSPSPTKPS